MWRDNSKLNVFVIWRPEQVLPSLPRSLLCSSFMVVLDNGSNRGQIAADDAEAELKSVREISKGDTASS